MTGDKMTASTADRVATPDDWRPEFPGQRPAFGPGNTASLVSGYKSPRTIAERAAELREVILATDPALAQPRHRFAVDAAAWAGAEVELIRTHVATVGMFDAKGNPRSSLLDRLNASERKAARAFAAIGFDPTSDARLRRDQAATVAFGGAELLAHRLAEGRALLDARDGDAATAIEAATTSNDDHDHDTTDREEENR